MNVKEFSFSCVSLFNYQGSCRLTAPTFYHIVFCLSSTFLKSFFNAFRHLCSFATAIPDYHICIFLSRTFLNFFQSFSTASLSFCDSLTIISFVSIFVNTFFVFLFFSFYSLNSNFDIISSSIYYVKLFLFIFLFLFLQLIQIKRESALLTTLSLFIHNLYSNFKY